MASAVHCSFSWNCSPIRRRCWWGSTWVLAESIYCQVNDKYVDPIRPWLLFCLDVTQFGAMSTFDWLNFGVVRQFSGRCQAVVRHFAGSCQTLRRQLSGNCQKVFNLYASRHPLHLEILWKIATLYAYFSKVFSKLLRFYCAHPNVSTYSYWVLTE